MLISKVFCRGLESHDHLGRGLPVRRQESHLLEDSFYLDWVEVVHVLKVRGVHAEPSLVYLVHVPAARGGVTMPPQRPV